jgi:hypothetical protein
LVEGITKIRAHEVIAKCSLDFGNALEPRRASPDIKTCHKFKGKIKKNKNGGKKKKRFLQTWRFPYSCFLHRSGTSLTP